uniref:Zinc finger domain containing protein n=1 Tax=Haemonchus contortus TaxID=6289 RepID=A0A7I4Y679_HAECO
MQLQEKQLFRILRKEMTVEAEVTAEQIRNLKEQVEQQEVRIANLKEIMHTREHEKMEETEPNKKGATLERAQTETETDRDYFEKMIQEIQGDEEVTNEQEEECTDNPAQVVQLREQALELEQVLLKFPYRDIGDSSGVANVCAFCDAVNLHFSDSCPEVQDGHDRNAIVNRKGLCKRCLGKCPQDKCRFRPRDCYYCKRIRGTIIEDLAPQKGHHRALCVVPDLRGEVRVRMKRLEKKIEHLRSERGFKPGGVSTSRRSFK